MTQKRTKRSDVTTALPKEAIREAMAELMGMEFAHARTPADSRHHPPKRLRARRLLWILEPTHTLELRNPVLDLYNEHVVIELGL
jgi:hypothetical protein